MEKEKVQFGAAVVIAAIVMILFALYTVNIVRSVPLVGPFVAGIVAGIVAGKNLLNGAKAGMIAGLIGAVLVAFDVFANIPFIRMSVPQFTDIGGVFFLVIALFYFSILGFIGGAIGGMVRTGVKAPETS